MFEKELGRQVRMFTELEKHLPFPHLSPVFLLICYHEKIHMTEISKHLDLEQVQVSRHVSALGKVYNSNRQKHKGPDLVYTEEDPDNRVKKIAYLSKKGQRLKEKILDILKGKNDTKNEV